jgi:hypothetical protein
MDETNEIWSAAFEIPYQSEEWHLILSENLNGETDIVLQPASDDSEHPSQAVGEFRCRPITAMRLIASLIGGSSLDTNVLYNDDPEERAAWLAELRNASKPE